MDAETPYLGDIGIAAFNFAPKNWNECNGQLLAKDTANQKLYDVLGARFGGDDVNTFGLPNLKERAPVHVGGDSGLTLGQVTGAAAHTLTSAEMPAHQHFLQATSARADNVTPGNTVQLARSSAQLYRAASNLVPMDAACISAVGGSQAHENRQPYLPLVFCICRTGLEPLRQGPIPPELEGKAVKPLIGEIRMFGGSFAPQGWLFCDGDEHFIAEYEALFQLIGTTYGGDGEEKFRVPDLCGRVPIHRVSGSLEYDLAIKGGVESVTLTTQQLSTHTHPLIASRSPANSPNPQGNLAAAPVSATPYYEGAPNAVLAPQSILPVGGSQPHENMQPFLCVNFIIAWDGGFPSIN